MPALEGPSVIPKRLNSDVSAEKEGPEPSKPKYVMVDVPEAVKTSLNKLSPIPPPGAPKETVIERLMREKTELMRVIEKQQGQISRLKKKLVFNNFRGPGVPGSQVKRPEKNYDSTMDLWVDDLDPKGLDDEAANVRFKASFFIDGHDQIFFPI